MNLAHLWVDRELKRQLDIVAATEQRGITVVANEALGEYLARRRHADFRHTAADSDSIHGADGGEE